MQIHVTPHHLTLTPSLRQFAADKIAALGDRIAEVFAAHIVLLHEHGHAPGGRFSARVRLAVRGNDVHAHGTDGDLYAAIDQVVDKLARRLRKRKTRRLARHRPTHRTRLALRRWPRRIAL
jgi:putative sigma-54 modulation protein